MFKVINNDTKWRRSGVFIVNFEHISYLVLVFLLLTFSKYMPVGLCWNIIIIPVHWVDGVEVT